MVFDVDVAEIAALVRNRSRAVMLSALADGGSMPAGELAIATGLTASGASVQLARLVAAGLLVSEWEGRHRYYRLAGPHVAAALEKLGAAAGPPRARPVSEELRYARRCYAHLGGELGADLAAALEAREMLVPDGPKWFRIGPAGTEWFSDMLGFNVKSVRARPHGAACRCLDWTEGRHHFAGALASALLRRWLATGWLVARREDRALRLTPAGQDGFRKALGIGHGLACDAA
jgi:DNA-binding transcriptional ArsR family regulator